MAVPKELAVAQAMTARKAFETLAKNPDAPHIDIATALEDYRIACRAAILENFDNPSIGEVEEQLWMTHGQVNNRFRVRIDKMRRESKHRVVEIRKLAKHYLIFIKSSQQFYREYILLLNQKLGGIEELQRVAAMWKQLDTVPVRGASSLRPEILRKAILSCYHTLIHLGDLSRYRASKIDDPEKRNWGPAVGYYGLAGEIWPESGFSHNQRAMIAAETGNHLGTIYHFYRALSTENPHPLAKDNLEKEFKRIISAWERGDPIKSNLKDGSSGTGSALIAWFVRLHSKCYRGQVFTGQDELENEVLGQLTADLKNRQLDTTLLKFVVINIAAQDCAYYKLYGNMTEELYQSYIFFLRLNVRSFLTLLRLLLSELQEDSTKDKNDNISRADLANRITVVSRRVLPGTRVYSSWFAEHWRVLASNIADASLRVHVRDLWQTYAEVLTKLATVFPAQLLPSLDYMLEEDAELIGFKPLLCDNTKRIWYTEEGSIRPKPADISAGRSHPNDEMLVRIRDLLIHGLELAARTDDAPLSLDGTRFVFADSNEVVPRISTPVEKPVGTLELQSQVRPDSKQANRVSSSSRSKSPSRDVPSVEHKTRSESSSIPIAPAPLTEDLAMSRMVDDLVGFAGGTEPFLETDMPPTPPEQTFDDTTFVNETTFGPSALSLAQAAKSGSSYAPKTPTATSPQVASQPLRPSISPPLGRQLASFPLLPDQSRIWASAGGIPSGPSSPFNQAEPGAVESPVHPYGPSRGHSRQHSAHSSRGSVDPWSTPYSAIPMSRTDSQGAAGTSGRRPPLPYGAHMHTPGNNFSVPALYGSPWNSGISSSQRRTPPNGQGG